MIRRFVRTTGRARNARNGTTRVSTTLIGISARGEPARALDTPIGARMAAIGFQALAGDQLHVLNGTYFHGPI